MPGSPSLVRPAAEPAPSGVVPPPAAKVSARGLGKTFRVRDSATGEHAALRGFDVDIPAGELLVVVGPSGCGKTTFLNILAGLDQATEGTLLVDGAPVRGPGLDRGVVFQQYALFPWRTALDKAWTWAWDHPKELQQQAAEIITENEGDPSLSRYVYPFGSRENALIEDGDIQFYIDQLTKKGDIEAGQVKPSDIYTNEFNPATGG